MLRSLACAALIALAPLLVPAPAAATETLRFDVLFRGITVARGTLGANTTEGAYALALGARATGLAALFARVRLDMTSEGRMTWPRLRPRAHSGDVDTGRRTGAVTLRWSRTTPEVVAIAPEPSEFAVPAAQAVGTIDPLSALWRVARSTPRRHLCDTRVQVYDGARRSQFGVAAPRIAGGTAECDGTYTRVAGYPPEDMAERRAFPFTAVYTENGALWDLTEVRATTLFGQVRVVFRD